MTIRSREFVRSPAASWMPCITARPGLVVLPRVCQGAFMRIRVVPSLALLALVSACPDDDPPPVADSTDTGADTTGSGSASTSAASVDTTRGSTSDPDPSTGSMEGTLDGADDTTTTGEPEQDQLSLFRATTVGLLAPNFYLPGCSLANESLPFFIDPALVADGDGDGIYDLSIVAGLELPDPAGIIRFGEAECTTTPEACALGMPDFDTNFEWMDAGDCYVPDGELFVTDSDVSQGALSAPCLVARDDALTINLGAFALQLSHAVVGTTTAADPIDTASIDGVIEGFLTKDVADNTLLPRNETFDALGISGQPLTNFLPRPFYECESTQSYTFSPDGEIGWYVLLTFSAGGVATADG